MKNKTIVFKLLDYELRVTSYQIFIFLGLVFLFWLTRIFHLTKLPVFCDEGIYVRWSQIMRNEPSLRFISLQDGKQPLFMWLTIPFLKVFKNPLFAGRMVSVFAGFFSLLGVISLPIIMNQSIVIGLISGLVYVLVPFTLFFDRMALVDSLLACFGIWSLNLSILLGKTKRLDVAMILGMVLGGGLITKSPGIFFVGLSVVTVIILNFRRGKSRLVPTIGKTVLLLAISVGIAFMIYNILRLGTNFHMLGLRNQDYIRSVDEILANPVSPTLAKMKDIWRYFWHYLTAPMLVLGGIGIIRGFRLFREIWLILLISILGPLVTQSAVAKTFTARYILFTAPMFIVFTSYGLSAVIRLATKRQADRRALLRVLILILVFTPAIIFDYHLWFSPAKANFPQDERKGYLEDWTAGWGITQIADYLKSKSKDKKIVVGTEGFFGTLPNGLQIYLEENKNISVIGSTYPVKSIPDSLLNALKAGDEVYLVVNRSRYKIENTKQREKLELIKNYPKPGEDELLLFKIK